MIKVEDGHIVFEHCIVRHSDPKKIDEVIQNISDGKFISYTSKFIPKFMDVGDSVIRLDDNTLELNFLSTRFNCPIIEYIFATSEDYVIKAMWYDPSYMTAGRFDSEALDVAGLADDNQDNRDQFWNLEGLTSEEIRRILPSDIDDEFGISTNLEAEEEEEYGDGEGNLEHS